MDLIFERMITTIQRLPAKTLFSTVSLAEFADKQGLLPVAGSLPENHRRTIDAFRHIVYLDTQTLLTFTIQTGIDFLSLEQYLTLTRHEREKVQILAAQLLAYARVDHRPEGVTFRSGTCEQVPAWYSETWQAL